MKNYVAPKSVVLSMNMNENIAISVVKEETGLLYNRNNGSWIGTELNAIQGNENYVTLGELIGMLASSEIAQKAWDNCQ